MKMVLRIDPLTRNEITTLNKIVGYDRRSRWRTQARILLFANDGYTWHAIAKRLGGRPSIDREALANSLEPKWALSSQQAECVVDQQQNQKRCCAMMLLMQQTLSHFDLNVRNSA